MKRRTKSEEGAASVAAVAIGYLKKKTQVG